MTRVFTGRITGNNIRHDYGDFKEEPKEYFTSTIEFKSDPFRGTITMYEIEGRYEIGSTVQMELSVFEKVQ